MTTGRGHRPEQVVRELAQADRMLGDGMDVADGCRELRVSEQTFIGGITSSAGWRPTTRLRCGTEDGVRCGHQHAYGHR